MTQRGTTRTLRLLWLACAGLLPAWALAQPLAQPAAPARFEIELQAAPELRAFLLPHLALQHFRTLPDLDSAELARLLALAPENLRELLGTLGHFSPQIEVGLQAAADPAAAPLGTVTIRVDAGPPTRIASSQVYFMGAIADAPEAAEQRAAIVRQATLPAGTVFTQAGWDAAKIAAVRDLTAQRFPAGRIDNSLADIDAASHSAHLHIALDSGPLVRIGAVRVQGAQRYDPLLVEHLVRLAGLRAGSEYQLELMQAAQQRVAASGYFDSVFVQLDLSGDPQAMPVLVQVREHPRQKLVLGAGLSTDNGARLSLEHTHHRVPGLGWRALSKIELEQRNQTLASEWSAPVDARGWRWMVAAQAQRQQDGYVSTTSQRLRAGRSQNGTHLERSFFLQADRAQAVNRAPIDPAAAPAELSLSAHYAWTRRRFVDLPAPERGDGLGVELSAGSTLQQDRKPFVRAHVRWLGIWPLDQAGATPDPAATPTAALLRGSRLVLRLQAGALWARPDAPVPATQLFLSGGGQTVRGYRLREIGVPQADGSVSPGRYLALASLEWQRPIWRHGVRSAWEHVLFLDSGAVANQPGQLRPRWGLGSGLRYNSPVGPLQVDLAYGADARRLRLHLNVGFTF